MSGSVVEHSTYVGMTHPLGINNDKLTSMLDHCGGLHSELYKKPMVKCRALAKNHLHHSMLNAKARIASFICITNHHHHLNLYSSDSITPRVNYNCSILLCLGVDIVHRLEN